MARCVGGVAAALLGCSKAPAPAQTPGAHAAAPSTEQQSPQLSPEQKAALAPAPVFNQQSSQSVELRLQVEPQTPPDAKAFWLAARFVPPPGTHIYWKNPGETGLATNAQFSSSPGGHISGEVLYPGPKRFGSERGSISYGYSGPTALFTRVRVDADAPLPLVLEVHASWLSCAEICVREEGSASTTWPSQAAPVTHASDPPFESLFEQLPGRTPKVTLERLTNGQLRLQTHSSARLLEYFPLQPLGPDDSAPTQIPGATPQELIITPRRRTPLDDPRGVVALELDGQRRYVQVSLPANGPSGRTSH